ncbi:Glucoamylase [Escovopsis weberi]|uniref:Glucoamylase n=1 Tax=Escovopsis weberi TaxID=150374 RepID=A0A0M8NA89_ESCWE|nr:Glucoamylase [Escovopsis weberi]
MHVLSTAVLVGTVAVQSVLGLGSANAASAKKSVDDFIKAEGPVALDLLLCNIGTSGCHSFNAGPGIVVASPSYSDPDYVFSWTRDAALVFKAIVDRFINHYDAGLQKHIEDYIKAQAKIQTISNPSGSLADGSGLGEAKFNIQPSAFNNPWGRPQRDGPALRAIAMIAYSKWLIANGYQSTVDSIWPVVRNDLNYVTQYWNQTGFDLWEEVKGSSFFTIANQHRALVEGANLAATLGQSGATYSSIAPQILCFMQTFWVSSGGYIDSNINQDNGRSGKDINSVLTAIHTFDPSIGCDSATFQPCSDKALSNLKVVVDSMRFYKVNAGIPVGKASAIGRYPEDVYYNGNPWYLATLAAAEQLYDAVYTWNLAGSITVTPLSLPFFQDLVPGIATGQFLSSSATFKTIVAAVTAYADGFVDVVAAYTPADGSLAEQFDKNTGVPLSAKNLTWSYASFLTAVDRRAGIIPAGWADGNATSIPLSCSGASAAGSYSAPSAVSFPPSQTPTGTVPDPTATSAPCSVPASIAVVFKETVVTQVGQTIKIVGNDTALGNWDPSRAVALNAADYSNGDPVWTASVNLPAGVPVQYKYINVASNGAVTWESDPNHTFFVPQACSGSALQRDVWQ